MKINVQVVKRVFLGVFRVPSIWMGRWQRLFKRIVLDVVIVRIIAVTVP